jgi:hypothetical protein
MSPEDAYTVFPEKVWLVAVVNDPVCVKPSAVLNAPPGLKMALYAVVTAVSFPLVQGAPLVGVQTKPVAVPAEVLKPVIVDVAPTLPVTTEVPVFDIEPPMSPKELAGPRSIESARALTANNEKARTRTNMEKMRNFILPPYPPPETYDPGFDHCRLNRGEVFLVRLIRVWPWESATTAEEKMGQRREPITVRGPLTGLPAVAMVITSTLPASPLLITVKHLPGFSKGKPQSLADQSCKVLSLARRMDVHFLRLTRCIRRNIAQTGVSGIGIVIEEITVGADQHEEACWP